MEGTAKPVGEQQVVLESETPENRVVEGQDEAQAQETDHSLKEGSDSKTDSKLPENVTKNAQNQKLPQHAVQTNVNQTRSQAGSHKPNPAVINQKLQPNDSNMDLIWRIDAIIIALLFMVISYVYIKLSK